MFVNRLVVTAALLAFAVVPVYSQQPTAPPDANLYTNYDGTPTSVNWIVCGSTQQSEGCFASGSIGPFVSVGAMLEGNPSVKGDVVRRAIYVVDTGATPVTLYVYKKSDTVTASSDTVTVTLDTTVPLSQLVGGSTAITYMTANAKSIYVGTSLGAHTALITKSNLSVSDLFPLSTNVSSITVNGYGFVTVTQGDGFAVYNPSGSLVEDGGGTQFMAGTMQGLPAGSLLPRF